LLVHDIRAEIEARLHIGAEAVADVAVELLVLPALVLPVAVDVIDRERADEIQRSDDPRKLRAAAYRAEAAAFKAQYVRCQRGVGGRRQEVNGAAECR
jgi:hypothetical protein